MCAAIYTREELQAEMSLWKKALSACATGKSYSIDGRSLTRHDLPSIRQHLAWLQDQLAAIDNRANTYFVRPMFRRG